MLPKQKLPKHLIEGYWRSVCQTINEKYGVSEKEARAETNRYRRLVAHKVGDMVYHENACDVARTIATGVFWKHVRQLLLGKFGLTAPAADRATASFLESAEARGTKASILDHDEKKIAGNIANLSASESRIPESA